MTRRGKTRGEAVLTDKVFRGSADGDIKHVLLWFVFFPLSREKKNRAGGGRGRQGQVAQVVRDPGLMADGRATGLRNTGLRLGGNGRVGLDVMR